MPSNSSDTLLLAAERGSVKVLRYQPSPPWK